MKFIMKTNYEKYSNIPLRLSSIQEGYDFRTIEEFFDLSHIDEKNSDDEIIDYALGYYYSKNWQWSGIRERPMCGHINHIININESLRTHNAKPLIDKINLLVSEYNAVCGYDDNVANDIDTISISFSSNCSIVDDTCVGTNMLLSSPMSDKLYDLLELYLYYITIIELVNGKLTVFIEPYYTECINDEIKRNQYVYHITDIKNINSIMRVGLRPKVGRVRSQSDSKSQTGYRYFPEKIFLCGRCDTREDTISNLRKIIDMKHIHNYAIIEIDPRSKQGDNGIVIDFWRDNAAPEIKNACYTFTAIPKMFISNVYYSVGDVK